MNLKLTNEEIEEIQSIIIDKMINEPENESKYNLLLDKLGNLKKYKKHNKQKSSNTPEMGLWSYVIV